MTNKILVVDDDAQLAQLMRISLETRDYEVIIARTGREGLERARADKPDLVVMDVMMPEMDGFEALQRMKSDESLKHIPVIMLTARGRSEDAVKGIEAGANFYLAKPFSTFELIAHVKQILEDAKPIGQETPVPYQGEEIFAEARRAESPKKPVRPTAPISMEPRRDTSSASEESFAEILQRLDRIERLLQTLISSKR